MSFTYIINGYLKPISFFKLSNKVEKCLFILFLIIFDFFPLNRDFYDETRTVGSLIVATLKVACTENY